MSSNRKEKGSSDRKCWHWPAVLSSFCHLCFATLGFPTSANQNQKCSQDVGCYQTLLLNSGILSLLALTQVFVRFEEILFLCIASVSFLSQSRRELKHGQTWAASPHYGMETVFFLACKPLHLRELPQRVWNCLNSSFWLCSLFF